MNRQEIRQVARGEFEYDRLRPGQEAAIAAVTEGRDTLAVMPTGAGKSAIYQIAGHVLPGATVIVSPLLALQRDQVGAIADQEVGEAAWLNSNLSAAEREDTLARFQQGGIAYLLLAPEQLAHADTLAALQAAGVTLFVVDEAHCVSAWGHDFRPDYLRLGEVIDALGHPVVLALTATAAPPVREEILERLRMREPRVIVRGFDRPNITLATQTFHAERAKQQALIEHVAAAEYPGIVYVATRKHAEELAVALQQQGVNAHHYHAGMKASERDRVEQEFMQDKLQVIVATIAFGMGIDKPNVRFVFHYDISESLDAYYQEIGRAGRDGDPAEAILFYRPEDSSLRRFQAAGGQIDPADVTAIIEELQHHLRPVAREDLRCLSQLAATRLDALLNALRDQGVITFGADHTISVDHDAVPSEVAAEVARREAQRQQMERSRVEMMEGYAETRGCRREYLLNYFGDHYAPPCDACDNCLAGQVEAALAENTPFPLNSRVAHATLGAGTVMRYEGDTMVVLFDEQGYQHLLTDLVTAEGLLTPEAPAP